MNVREIHKGIVEQLGFIQAEINFNDLDINIDHGEDQAYLDIRLRLQADGSFDVFSGDPSYDQDHRGFWGSSSIAVDTDLEETAHDLLNQALDAQSYSESQSDSTITDILEKGI